MATVIISNKANNREIQHKLETQQAVFDTKLDVLTEEVKAHNNFTQRLPVVDEQIKNITHRLEALEHEKVS
ncbi:MAG: hypothetical protein J6Y64_11015 [Ruminococcus sp.]|nr:hypothetical protein [Ruminococcus sp.]